MPKQASGTAGTRGRETRLPAFRLTALGGLAAACLLSGCAHSRAPEEYLQSAEEIQRTSWGGWIEVSQSAQPDSVGRPWGTATLVEGELLAVEPDRLFVLTAASWVGRSAQEPRIVHALRSPESGEVFSGSGVIEVPRTRVGSARLTGYSPGAEGLVTLTLLGSASTLSHGWFLALSLPAWIVTGVVSTSRLTHEPEVKYPQRAWVTLDRYARYAGGWPAGLDPNVVR